MANRSYDGLAHNEAQTGWGIRSRNSGRCYIVHGYVGRHSSEHYSHNHWSHRRRRSDSAIVRGEMGSGRPSSLGLDSNDSAVGSDSRDLFSSRSSLALTTAKWHSATPPIDNPQTQLACEPL